jgi:hypothetical protein
MRPDDVLVWLRAAPFRPFRITLNSGRSYDIRHPEMVRVGRSYLDIFFFAGEPADPHEKMEMVSLLLVERLEPVEAPAPSPQANPSED